MSRATVTKTVRLPAKLAADLEAAAKATGNSENQVFITAVANFVSRPSVWAKIHPKTEGSQGYPWPKGPIYGDPRSDGR